MGKLTGWYPPEIKPVRTGVYLTIAAQFGLHPDWEFYSVWDGKQWCADRSQIELAEISLNRSTYQERSWRGLASDPAKGGV